MSSFKLYLQGYEATKNMMMSDFKIDKHHPKNYLVLFASQSNEEIKVGEEIRTITHKNKLWSVRLKIISVSIGFGKPIDLIPKGYKSAILVKGSLVDIATIQNSLPCVNGWGESDKDFIAIDSITKPIRANKQPNTKNIVTGHYGYVQIIGKKFGVTTIKSPVKNINGSNHTNPSLSAKAYRIKKDAQNTFNEELAKYRMVKE